MTSSVGKNNKCSKCKRSLPNKEYLTCSKCKLSYDLDCADVTVQRFYNTLTGDHRKKWKCNPCIEKHRHQESASKNYNTITPSNSSRGAELESLALVTPTAATEISNITVRRNVINVPTENSFESLSTDHEEEDTIISSPESSNKINRSCPDLTRINDLERIKDMERTILELHEKLASADQEVVKLLLENNSLKEVISKQNQKINQLTQICGSPNMKAIQTKSRKTSKKNTNSHDHQLNFNELPNSEQEGNISKENLENSVSSTNNITTEPIEQHKIKILSDEHLSGLSAALLKSRVGKWNDKYYPTAYIASEAPSSRILEMCNNNFLDSLSDGDIVVLCVGAHDQNIVRLESELHLALTKLKHLTVYVVPVYKSIHLNVKLLNYRLKLCTNIYPKCVLIDADIYKCIDKTDYLMHVCYKLNVYIDHKEYACNFLDPKKVVAYCRTRTVNRSERHSNNNKKNVQVRQTNMLDYFPTVNKNTQTAHTIHNNTMFFRPEKGQ